MPLRSHPALRPARSCPAQRTCGHQEASRQVANHCARTHAGREAAKCTHLLARRRGSPHLPQRKGNSRVERRNCNQCTWQRRSLLTRCTQQSCRSQRRPTRQSEPPAEQCVQSSTHAVSAGLGPAGQCRWCTKVTMGSHGAAGCRNGERAALARSILPRAQHPHTRAAAPCLLHGLARGRRLAQRVLDLKQHLSGLHVQAGGKE